MDEERLRDAVVAGFKAEVEPAPSRVLGPTTVQTLIAAGEWERAADRFLEVFLAYDATIIGRNALRVEPEVRVVRDAVGAKVTSRFHDHDPGEGCEA